MALNAGDWDSALLAEGGGERLPEGLRVDDGEACALAVVHRETATEADSDGLGDEDRDADAEGEGLADAEAQAVGERVLLPLRLTSGEGEGEPLPLRRPLVLGLAVPLGVAAIVLLSEALRPMEGVSRGENEGESEAQEVTVALFEGDSWPDSVWLGLVEALPHALADCVDEEDEEGEPEGSREALSRLLAEAVGGALVGDARGEKLGDAEPLSDTAGADGEPAPLKEAGLAVADGAPLLLAMLPVAVPENCGDAVAVPEPPCGEGEPLPDAQVVGLPEGEGVVELLAQVVMLPLGDCVCEPLALAQLLPVGAPPVGDEVGDGVPTSLLVLEGDVEVDSHTVRVGAALVRVAQGVEDALARKDADTVVVSVAVDEGVAKGVADDSAAVALGLPESEPAPAEGVPQEEALALLLALPVAVLGAVADVDTEGERETRGVAHADAAALLEMEALPEKETTGLVDADVEGQAESEAKEPLESGVGLAVPGCVPEGVVLPDTVGLAPPVAVADSELVVDPVPLLLLVDDAL